MNFMRLLDGPLGPLSKVPAAILLLSIFAAQPSAAADPDDYTATLICRSLLAEPGQELSSATDPHYVAEFPLAYADMRLKISADVRENGKYQFLLRFKPSGQFSGGFDFETERILAAGPQVIELPVTVSELQRQRGLLWSILPGRQSEIELTVSRIVLRGEVEQRSGTDLSKIIDEMRRKGARPSDLAVLDVPPNRPINKFVSRGNYTIDLAPVERKMAR